MNTMQSDLITRAASLLESAHFAPLAHITVAEYVRVADRIQAARVAAGADWHGLDGLDGARNTKSVMRSAWTRRTHREVALALHELRTRRVGEAECMERLANWVPEAEACKPHPGHVVQGGTGAAKAPQTLSKRHVLAELPTDWMDQLWRAGVARGFKHIDSLAVLIATGCRPAEVCQGVAVRVTPGCLEIAIAGVKVSDQDGQPWRKLSVALDGMGPVAHLAMKACMSVSGTVRVRAACTPAALSMAVTSLADELGLPHRVSPYDIRHQRTSDARIAFGGDADMLAAWLGHAGTSSARHYGRLPRSSGVRGPQPLGAVAPREIRHAITKANPQLVSQF